MDLMVDIETLGNSPGDMIISLSAVPFDIKTGEVYNNNTSILYPFTVNIDYSQEKILKVNMKTLKWWLGQDLDAIRSTFFNEQHSYLLNTKKALENFSFYIEVLTQKVKAVESQGNLYLWGNSARFDFGLLEGAYKAYDMEIPWKHYNERDVRTLVSFAPHIKEETKFEGVQHYSLDDCLHQIKYCCETYKHLTRG